MKCAYHGELSYAVLDPLVIATDGFMVDSKVSSNRRMGFCHYRMILNNNNKNLDKCLYFQTLCRIEIEWLYRTSSQIRAIVPQTKCIRVAKQCFNLLDVTWPKNPR